MAGDLLVFPRGENKHRAARRGIADRILYRPIPSFVETHADPGQSVADRGARFPVVFSDAAGDQVDAAPLTTPAKPKVSFGLPQDLPESDNPAAAVRSMSVNS
jgi:hypothetical protein